MEGEAGGLTDVAGRILPRVGDLAEARHRARQQVTEVRLRLRQLRQVGAEGDDRCLGLIEVDVLMGGMRVRGDIGDVWRVLDLATGELRLPVLEAPEGEADHAGAIEADRIELFHRESIAEADQGRFIQHRSHLSADCTSFTGPAVSTTTHVIGVA